MLNKTRIKINMNSKTIIMKNNKLELWLIWCRIFLSSLLQMLISYLSVYLWPIWTLQTSELSNSRTLEWRLKAEFKKLLADLSFAARSVLISMILILIDPLSIFIQILIWSCFPFKSELFLRQKSSSRREYHSSWRKVLNFYNFLQKRSVLTLFSSFSLFRLKT